MDMRWAGEGIRSRRRALLSARRRRNGSLGAQAGQPWLIEGGPALAPAADRFGVLEGARPLLQQGRVVQGIEDILLPALAAGRPGQHPVQKTTWL